MKKCIFVVLVSSVLGFANQGETMQVIEKAGSLGSFKGDSKIFSGDVQVHMMFKANDFSELLNKQIKEDNNLLEYENPLNDPSSQKDAHPAVMSVVVDKVVRDDREFRMKYEPGHPDANAEGYVAYPNINPVIEMADLIEATRAYQANVAAFNSTKSIAQSAIELLRG